MDDYYDRVEQQLRALTDQGGHRQHVSDQPDGRDRDRNGCRDRRRRGFLWGAGTIAHHAGVVSRRRRAGGRTGG